MAGVTRTWISSTLATELVSLAAARATLGIVEREQVPLSSGPLGARLLEGFRTLAGTPSAALTGVGGVPEMCFLQFADDTVSRAVAAARPTRPPLQAVGLQLRLAGAHRGRDRPGTRHSRGRRERAPVVAYLPAMLIDVHAHFLHDRPPARRLARAERQPAARRRARRHHASTSPRSSAAGAGPRRPTSRRPPTSATATTACSPSSASTPPGSAATSPSIRTTPTTPLAEIRRAASTRA